MLPAKVNVMSKFVFEKDIDRFFIHYQEKNGNFVFFLSILCNLLFISEG